MRKRMAAALLCGAAVLYLSGCQKAPEISENGEIAHAKSQVEQAIEDVVTQETEGSDDSSADPTYFDGVIGTQENGLWVCAEIPALPGTVYRLTLQPRDDLDEALLTAFLGSETGTVQDITQTYLAEQNALLSGTSEETDAGDGIETSQPVEMAYFGDDSILVLSDGNKTALFSGNTSATYRDEELLQACNALYKTAPEKALTRDSDADAAFSLTEALELLQKKLETIGITEICTNEVFYYEMDGSAFYEIQFEPCYEGVGIAHEFGQTGTEDVHPSGSAWVTEDGVAEISLTQALGKIAEQAEAETVLSFSQAAAVLEKYLESGSLIGCAEAKLTQIDFVYYPVYEDSQLTLKPAWHICVPLRQMLESEDEGYDKLFNEATYQMAVRNVYLDAGTGELLWTE